MKMIDFLAAWVVEGRVTGSVAATAVFTGGATGACRVVGASTIALRVCAFSHPPIHVAAAAIATIDNQVVRLMLPPTEPRGERKGEDRGDFPKRGIIPYRNAPRRFNCPGRNFSPVRGLRLYARRPAHYRAVPRMRPADRPKHRRRRAPIARLGGRRCYA